MQEVLNTVEPTQGSDTGASYTSGERITPPLPVEPPQPSVEDETKPYVENQVQMPPPEMKFQMTKEQITGMQAALAKIQRKWQKKRHLTIWMFEDALAISTMFSIYIEQLEAQIQALTPKEPVHETNVAEGNQGEPQAEPTVSTEPVTN